MQIPDFTVVEHQILIELSTTYEHSALELIIPESCKSRMAHETIWTLMAFSLHEKRGSVFEFINKFDKQKIYLLGQTEMLRGDYLLVTQAGGSYEALRTETITKHEAYIWLQYALFGEQRY